jgi:hypothetical protein
MKKIIVSLFIVFLFLIVLVLYNRFFYRGELIGIKGTDNYHRDSCQFVKKASIDKIIFFDDLNETAEYGSRPCNTCNPPGNEKQLDEVMLQLEKIKIEEEKIEEENKANQAKMDEAEIKNILEKAKSEYQNGKVISFHLFAGLINKKYITEDSILKIPSKTEFVLLITSATIHPTLLPTNDEIELMKLNGYLSSENSYLKKIIEEDNKYGVIPEWYKEGKTKRVFNYLDNIKNK